ncbi:MAG: hypothetical protein ACYS30_25730, partial [Planctomycetota bacterium]
APIDPLAGGDEPEEPVVPEEPPEEGGEPSPKTGDDFWDKWRESLKTRFIEPDDERYEYIRQDRDERSTIARYINDQYEIARRNYELELAQYNQAFSQWEAQALLGEAAAVGYDDRGFPLNPDGTRWDYKAAKLDPWGTPKPRFAIGFDNYGKPVYEENLIGFIGKYIDWGLRDWEREERIEEYVRPFAEIYVVRV